MNTKFSKFLLAFLLGFSVFAGNVNSVSAKSANQAVRQSERTKLTDAELTTVKTDFFSQLDQLRDDGWLSYEDDMEATGAILSATTVEDFEAVGQDFHLDITVLSGIEKNLSAARRKEIQDIFIVQLDEMYDEGFITLEDNLAIGAEILGAKKQSEFDAIAATYGFTFVLVEKDLPEEERKAISDSFLAQLDEMFENGFVTMEENWSIGIDILAAKKLSEFEALASEYGFTFDAPVIPGTPLVPLEPATPVDPGTPGVPVTPTEEELQAIKDDLLAKLDEMYEAGLIDYDENWAIGAEIIGATTLEELEVIAEGLGTTVVVPVQPGEEDLTEAQIKALREHFLKQLNEMYEAGFVTYDENWMIGDLILNATKRSEFEAIAKEYGFTFDDVTQPEEPAEDLKAIKDALLSQLDEMYEAGFIDYEENWMIGDLILNAKTLEELEAIAKEYGLTLEEVTQPEEPEEPAEDLKVIKDYLISQLDEMYEAGLITYDENWMIGDLILNAKTLEELEAIAKEYGLTLEPKQDIPLTPLEPSTPVDPSTPGEVIPWTPLEPATPVVPLTPLDPAKPVEPTTPETDVPLVPLTPAKPVEGNNDKTPPTGIASPIFTNVLTAGAGLALLTVLKKKSSYK